MAEKRKSIVDESLFEANQIEEAFEANAKEVLAHTMGLEIEQMVKESLEDSELEDDDNEEATDLELSLDGDDEGEVEFDLDLDDEGEDNDLDIELDMDDDEGEMEFDLDDIASDEDDVEIDLDTDMGDDIETVDLTSASDSEVITVFKKMGPTDEIEVVRSGDTIDIVDNQTNSEYRIELGDDSIEPELDIDADVEMDDEMFALGESENPSEVIYEIELDEEDDMITDDDMEDMDESMYEMEDDEYDLDSAGGPDWNLPRSERERRNPSNMRGEASRTLGNGRKWGRRGLDKPVAAPRHLRQESEKPRISKLLKENTVLKTDIKNEQSKVQELSEDNQKLVGALKELRKKLQEVAVFNSNLTYSVRLISENATTRDEKVEILKRMDEAKTIKESKAIYKSLVSELNKTKTSIKENIEEKLNESKTSGSAQISESRVYVNPELEKMKKLWEFDYKYNK